MKRLHQWLGYIYDLAEEGLGLHCICKRLHDEKILKPSCHKKEMFERFVDDGKMYDWDNAYVSQLLHSPTYAGHLAVDCKPTISMKTKKRKYIAFADREIIRKRMKPLYRKHNGTEYRQSYPAEAAVLTLKKQSMTISFGIVKVCGL